MGTICEIDGFCWAREQERLRREREAKTLERVEARLEEGRRAMNRKLWPS